MAQWVKNLTSAAQVDVEAQVRSPAQHGELKDLALPQLWHRLQLRLRFNPWPRNFRMLWVQPLKREKKGAEGQDWPKKGLENLKNLPGRDHI